MKVKIQYSHADLRDFRKKNLTNPAEKLVETSEKRHSKDL